MSTDVQAHAVIELAPTPTTTATHAIHPAPDEVLAAALDEPAIWEAIRRGARKAQTKKYSVVTKSARGGVCEHTSDAVQATYLALLDNYAHEYTTLPPEERPRFVEELAKSIAWREVYPMKREVPLVEPVGGEEIGSEGPQFFACDDVSINRARRRPSWIAARASESELIERIDRTRTPPEEAPETRYEHMCRLLGPEKADWMLDYENNRYESAKTPAERVRYFRLRRKLEM